MKIANYAGTAISQNRLISCFFPQSNQMKWSLARMFAKGKNSPASQFESFRFLYFG
ncbi:MAG: hypothetical protein ACK42F_09005 [Sphingobacteriales bacterium]